MNRAAIDRFSLAETYWVIGEETSALAEQQDRASLRLALPTLFGLATELYLKCLLFIRHGGNPRGHDLVKLFEALPEADRERIRSEAEPVLSQIRQRMRDIAGSAGGSGAPVFEDFESMLNAARDAFVKWRYAHEGLDSSSGWTIGPISMAIRGIIIEQVPECADAAARLRGQHASPRRS